MQLRKQIADAEDSNMDKRPWYLMGEVTASERPEDSLLTRHLDFKFSDARTFWCSVVRNAVISSFFCYPLSTTSKIDCYERDLMWTWLVLNVRNSCQNATICWLGYVGFYEYRQVLTTIIDSFPLSCSFSNVSWKWIIHERFSTCMVTIIYSRHVLLVQNQDLYWMQWLIIQLFQRQLMNAMMKLYQLQKKFWERIMNQRYTV